MTRVLFIAAIAASMACTASASYELAMYGAGSLGVVQRYDPVTGASLGSIGAGYLGNPKGVSLDGTTGDILVADYASGRIVKFNYSTGEYKSSFYVGADVSAYRVSRLSDDTILVGDEANSLVRYSATGSKIEKYTFPGATGSTLSEVQTSSGFIWVMTSSKQLFRITPGNTTATLTSFAVPSANFPVGLSAKGNAIAYGNFGDDMYEAVLNTTAGGGVSLGPLESLGGVYANSMAVRATAFGHGAILYSIVQDFTTSKNYIYRWDTTSSFHSRFLVAGDGYSGTQMAVVVAPEPQTIAAMLMGCAMLLCRRRNR